jgi:hypothetical protein
VANSVLIGFKDEGLQLTLGDGPDSVVAQLRSGGLVAVRSVFHGLTASFEDLIAFFVAMADEWRGWDGEKVCGSRSKATSGSLLVTNMRTFNFASHSGCRFLGGDATAGKRQPT